MPIPFIRLGVLAVRQMSKPCVKYMVFQAIERRYVRHLCIFLGRLVKGLQAMVNNMERNRITEKQEISTQALTKTLLKNTMKENNETLMHPSTVKSVNQDLNFSARCPPELESLLRSRHTEKRRKVETQLIESFQIPPRSHSLISSNEPVGNLTGHQDNLPHIRIGRRIISLTKDTIGFQVVHNSLGSFFSSFNGIFNEQELINEGAAFFVELVVYAIAVLVLVLELHTSSTNQKKKEAIFEKRLKQYDDDLREVRQYLGFRERTDYLTSHIEDNDGENIMPSSSNYSVAYGPFSFLKSVISNKRLSTSTRRVRRILLGMKKWDTYVDPCFNSWYYNFFLKTQNIQGNKLSTSS